jgi:hypothetical protein
MSTESIIVYRNPLEQQFWESGIVFPLIVFMVAAVVGIVLLTKLAAMFTRPMTKANDIANWVAIGTGVGIAAWVSYGLLIS